MYKLLSYYLSGMMLVCYQNEFKDGFILSNNDKDCQKMLLEIGSA